MVLDTYVFVTSGKSFNKVLPRSQLDNRIIIALKNEKEKSGPKLKISFHVSLLAALPDDESLIVSCSAIAILFLQLFQTSLKR